MNKLIQNNIDKLLRLFINYFIITMLGTAIPLWLAALITAIIGIGKEVYDKLDYGEFDWKDLIADGIGILLGIIRLII